MGNVHNGVRIVENPNELYEYNKNVRPPHKPVPAISHPAKLHEECNTTKDIPLDLSSSLGLDYPASCPNLLAGYIHVKANDTFKQDCVLCCTSLCLYVIRGHGTTKIFDEGAVAWSKGDVLVIPYQTRALEHSTIDDTVFYYVHDGPLLKYLRVTPSSKAFPTTVFREKLLKDKVENIREKPGSEHANRLGTLIGNPETSETKSLTHTLWALLNVLPANSMQKPHRHNAVALDLVTYAPEGKCYTLVGDELDENGQIKNPIRLDWESGGAFTTPLGLWHSHHNESEDEDAWILPVQDAGLSLHQGLYDIRFADEEWKYLHDKHAIKSIIY
ncbi:unnamed protein product [Adineta ricciae]|uniref:Uncharacterized protein n=1 Tax=Adineta ricciae TaxID=249248 RepID=A0A813Q1G3_ADIRI|nr:unnamed protein product [Adineta ricciae]CAF1110324.1 unnamed protein product [Adineta ricciae]